MSDPPHRPDDTAIGQAVRFVIWASIAVLCYEAVARYVFGQPTIWAHG